MFRVSVMLIVIIIIFNLHLMKSFQNATYTMYKIGENRDDDIMMMMMCHDLMCT